jgi:coatomer subunit beta'
VQLWKRDLALQNPRAAESLANPSEYPNLFPDLEDALRAETCARPAAAPALLPPTYSPAPDLPCCPCRHQREC